MMQHMFVTEYTPMKIRQTQLMTVLNQLTLNILISQSEETNNASPPVELGGLLNESRHISDIAVFVDLFFVCLGMWHVLVIELPVGWFGAIFARSGIATKRGLRPANCVPVIDCDYRGEWLIPIHNDSNETKTVQAGERIAQLILLPYQDIDFKEVDELSDTDRGSSGFGSSGEK